MSVELWPVLISLAILFLLFAAEVPVAFALGIAGLVGMAQLNGVWGALNSLSAIPYNTTASYTLTVVPMFILMGLLVSHSGMIDGIFNVAQRLTRRVPGGLGVATVLAATFFGGISGSSVADAATIGRVSIGEMAKRGYDKAYAAAIVAAAGTVDILIPPSVALVMYGIVSGASIGALLLAGILPGLLTAFIYALLIIFTSNRPKNRAKPEQAVSEPIEVPSRGFSAREVFGVLGGMVLFLVVIGGIYSGAVTATEAGALGTFASLILSILFVMVWNKSGKWPAVRHLLVEAFGETGAMTAMIFALIVGATIFSHFLVLSGVPDGLSDWVLSLGLPPSLVVVALLLVLLPLGMFIDGLSMLLIMAPLFHPVVEALGYDGIWFGILFIKCIEIGLLTPPVGLNVFVVAGLFKDIRVEDVFRRITPFIVAELIVTVILFSFPAIITFLPELAGVK
ncbi:MAG TPA: TRAP transporter large permease [Rhizobiaceae bacterium]|nr:TRAP transporter large permease [Rhizobiaceae bacterium]